MQVQTGPRVALLSQRPPRKLSIRSDAGVAKLADAQDLKSWDSEESCGFDSRPRHQSLGNRALSPPDEAGDSSLPFDCPFFVPVASASLPIALRKSASLMMS